MRSHHIAIPAAPPIRTPVLDTPPIPADVEAALGQILASPLFCRSHRMSRLLRYLVAQSVAGARRETSEYSIGIAVFDRDPGSYDTCDDPIVRVQAGRLRDKLRSYYATSGSGAPLRISIPLGSYMPEIVLQRPSKRSGRAGQLAFTPLTLVDQPPGAAAYAAGLNDELAHQLFKAFGSNIVTHAAGQPPGGLRLEGSIRIDGAATRVSLRLIACDSSAIEWSQQFDAPTARGIAAQEQLAHTICAGLQRHFAGPA